MLKDAVSLLFDAAAAGTLKRATFSKPQSGDGSRITLRVCTHKGDTLIATEKSTADGKVYHKNFSVESAENELFSLAEPYMQINIISSLGDAEYKRSAKGKEIIIGGDKLKRALTRETPSFADALTETLDRKKNYILSGCEPFLIALGVSDARGRVHDKKQAKFRQINRFLELIRDVEDKLPAGDIRICDLCCGKSYLSFAVYHYFANIKQYRVKMTGVDLKSDVVERCNMVATQLGFDGLEFLCEDIRDYTPDVLPSLVISLHACDIATDFVLTRAADWKTDVILSTPCCHHELNHNINCPELSFITEYSMLRQKICDAATDALRLCRLEAQGYATMALELIDPDETPKNIMLRAVRKKNFDPASKSAQAAMQRYLDAKSFLCGENLDKDLHF